ncbi:hypothetical protein A1O1_06939 [Capronia coronata CBS 617.96]|uniref:Proline dehydrogenase n=1 Tax=Capronia coronata CBS 617.96 TaxID=1182541 RepID=W9XSW1_9EURO|nr:uncharacterized protein A1O1_06939 [Capronia coronata CBS 617.96]EXJ83318.1 hypothetical protein A1O1_06939 [Capronia coronata CBS 617.96]
MTLPLRPSAALRLRRYHILCSQPASAPLITQCAETVPSRRDAHGYPVRPSLSQQRRKTHTRRSVTSTAYGVTNGSSASSDVPPSTVLSCLPLSNLIRSYVITSVSSIPALLRPSLAVMTFLAHTKSPLFDPDRNPILHFLLKKTFYAQFCAGETPLEVKSTIASLKDIGFKGVILGHAKEVVLSKDDEAGLDSAEDCTEQASCNAREITTWKQNTIETVKLAQPDDFVALKFTGAGRQALQHLKATIACSPEFEEAVHDICKHAQSKGVRLLFDAEQAALQQGVDNWTMYFAKEYNKERALVFGTYQCYAQRTPKVLATHLDLAKKENFVLGVKLVRGAYMESDPRELFWPTIEDTHKCYNGIAKSIIERKYGDVLQPVEGGSSDFPQVSLVLATHNAESVKLALRLRDEQAQRGEPLIELAYGQLMGMADHVSCEVVQAARARAKAQDANVEVPSAYKYVVWGKLGECMKYLLRRAQENRDAVTRTIEARQALGRELGSRMAFWR